MAKRGNPQWDQFEAKLRNKKQKNVNAKAVPSDIDVQRMSSIATGRLSVLAHMVRDRSQLTSTNFGDFTPSPTLCQPLLTLMHPP